MVIFTLPGFYGVSTVRARMQQWSNSHAAVGICEPNKQLFLASRKGYGSHHLWSQNHKLYEWDHRRLQICNIGFDSGWWDSLSTGICTANLIEPQNQSFGRVWICNCSGCANDWCICLWFIICGVRCSIAKFSSVIVQLTIRFCHTSISMCIELTSCNSSRMIIVLCLDRFNWARVAICWTNSGEVTSLPQCCF